LWWSSEVLEHKLPAERIDVYASTTGISCRSPGLQQVRPLALTLTLLGEDGTQLAKLATSNTFRNCQRLKFICAAKSDKSSLQAMHLALRDALPHMGHLESVDVEVEGQHSSAW
jgi:hypothetical protein